MAREEYVSLTVIHGSFCVSYLHGKLLVKNFQILTPKNAEVVNLKNADLDLIRSILLECGYFGLMVRFWISPKKRKIRFWIQESVFEFSQQKASLYYKNHRVHSVQESIISWSGSLEPFRGFVNLLFLLGVGPLLGSSHSLRSLSKFSFKLDLFCLGSGRGRTRPAKWIDFLGIAFCLVRHLFNWSRYLPPFIDKNTSSEWRIDGPESLGEEMAGFNYARIISAEHCSGEYSVTRPSVRVHWVACGTSTVPDNFFQVGGSLRSHTRRGPLAHRSSHVRTTKQICPCVICSSNSARYCFGIVCHCSAMVEVLGK